MAAKVLRVLTVAAVLEPQISHAKRRMLNRLALEVPAAATEPLHGFNSPANCKFCGVFWIPMRNSQSQFIFKSFSSTLWMESVVGVFVVDTTAALQTI